MTISTLSILEFDERLKRVSTEQSAVEQMNDSLKEVTQPPLLYQIAMIMEVLSRNDENRIQ